MINQARAWPCEYCGETHDPLVLCVPRLETIFALMVGVGAQLACQYVVEPEPNILIQNEIETGIGDEMYGQSPLVYFYNVVPQFAAIPPAQGAGGALTIEMLQQFADDVERRWREPAIELVPAMDWIQWDEAADGWKEPRPVVIPTRNLLARVRITPEMLNESRRPRYRELDAAIKDLKPP